MGINITILVQIINFIIAYWIIRIFLLNPTMKVILQERDLQDSLTRSIEVITQENQVKKHQLADHWASCQRECEEQCPKLGQPSTFLEEVTHTMEAPEFDTQTSHALVDELADQLAERISHV